MPSGAEGRPLLVYPELLPETPALLLNFQEESVVGSSTNVLGPTLGCSNPGSPTLGADTSLTDWGTACVTEIASMSAVLSPVAVSRPWKVMVWDPAAALKGAVV